MDAMDLKLDELFHDREIPLMEAYLKLASTMPVNEITLQKIAACASVSFGKTQSLLGKHRENITVRAALYVSIRLRDWVTAYMQEHIHPNTDPVHVYIRANIDWAYQNPNQTCFFPYFNYLTMINQKVRNIHISQTHFAKNRLAELFHLARKNGFAGYPELSESQVDAVYSFIFGDTYLFFLEHHNSGISQNQAEKKAIQRLKGLSFLNG